MKKLEKTVFCFTQPGERIVSDDKQWASDVNKLIMNLKNAYLEANVAMNLYAESAPASIGGPQHMLDVSRKRDIGMGLMQQPGGNTPEAWARNRYETNKIFNNEAVKQGRIPSEFSRIEKNILAKAFLFALDNFFKTLVTLTKMKEMPGEVILMKAEFEKVFPDVLEVRNTAHHMEDRVLGLNQKGKMIALKPIDDGQIRAENGALLLNNVINDSLSSTMKDGNVGRVAVSEESMVQLREIFQKILESFAWFGSVEYLPHID